MEIRAILLDLHHTLTTTKSSVIDVVRQIMNNHGLDTSHLSDALFVAALDKADQVMASYQVSNNVGPHWGADPEDWLMFDRIFLEELGFHGFTDDDILTIENEFKAITRDSDWEYFTEDALSAIRTLHAMGFTLGICTKRNDNPQGFLSRSKVADLFETVQWSGVAGYAKPSPYTLLEAVKEIGVNPRRCLFVGNYVGVDVEAALRCEMIPVLLSWANPREADKAPPECIVLDKPTDLVEWIRSQSPHLRQDSE